MTTGESYLRRVRHALRRSPEEVKEMPRAEYANALRAIVDDLEAQLDAFGAEIMAEFAKPVDPERK